MRAMLAAIDGLALTDDNRQHQSGSTSSNVHNRTASEVNWSDQCFTVSGTEQLCRQPLCRVAQQATAPDHEGHWEVHQRRPEADENQPGGELHAFGQRPRDQRYRNRAERELEPNVDDVWVTVRTRNVVAVAIRD